MKLIQGEDCKPLIAPESPLLRWGIEFLCEACAVWYQNTSFAKGKHQLNVK